MVLPWFVAYLIYKVFCGRTATNGALCSEEATALVLMVFVYILRGSCIYGHGWAPCKITLVACNYCQFWGVLNFLDSSVMGVEFCL